MTVEVFKTNVEETSQASELVAMLSHHFPSARINFDLDDCDKILRVQGESLCHKTVIELVTISGYHCQVLE